MFKSLDPRETREWFSPQHPDTVFTVRAFTGVHMAFTSDSIMNQALNECVVSVTNFAVYFPVLDKDKKETGKSELKKFAIFEPSKYPKIKMSKVLVHTMATGVFNLIWGMTTLSKAESGE